MAFNRVVLIGRLTKDPEIRMTPSGEKVANFTLAVDRDYKGKDGNKPTDFINITAFGKKADFVENYLFKGMAILIEGQLRTESWKTKEGYWKNKAYIAVDRFVFVEKRKDPADEYQEKYLKDVNEIDHTGFEEIEEIEDDDLSSFDEPMPEFFPLEDIEE